LAVVFTHVSERITSMKYLVTGAAGFIGSNLVLELVSQGHQVIAVDALIETTYSAEIKYARWEILKKVDGVEFIEKNLTIGALDEIIEPVDFIVNQAAMPGLMKSWSDIKMYSDSNIVIVGNILNSIKKFPGKRLVHISTSSVYGKSAVGDETTEAKPYSPYGVTKLAAEKLITAYRSNFELDFVILRYFSVYGPGQRPDMGYSIFIDKISQNIEFELYGDGSQTRTNTYIDDCVRGTVLASQNAKNGEVYNIAGKDEVSVSEALEILENEIGNKAKIKFLPTRPGDQTSTKGTTTKAFKDFNFLPRTSIKAGLKAQVAAYKTNSLFNAVKLNKLLNSSEFK
jgi:UDP-glucuronate 4-epimerase